ncbi:trypsin-1-like isoform X3 [Trichoplusia ni]|uniref:Trypsin-1-like isoform X3 n=1 Tax=Trichoplusia ni TaxID=7111 RepID=A0A7E5W0S0_TRINI|nr:trypsin-1-like isoform X3 [Trichoplusia ni]
MGCRNALAIVIVGIIVDYSVECGRVKRVIGAEVVECGIQPRAVSLQNASSSQHLCGGTIISPYYALTAAHCVQSNEDQYVLQLNNYCVPEGAKFPTATVKKIIKHEKFDPVTKAHDIALLRITLHLCDKSWLKEQILPKSSFGLSGECTIYGYGFQDLETKETSTELLAGKLEIVSLDECRRELGPYVAPDYDSGMICAVGEGVDACQGDSGSPLICSRGKLEGISSYGMSCAVPGLPGVYTSVAAHLNWIRENMKYYAP